MEKYIGNNFVDPLDSPLSRRGSFIAFANSTNGENLYGKCTLWLCNCRIGMFAMSGDLHAPNGFRAIKLELVKNGRVLPVLIETTPYEVVLKSQHGEMRFTIAERKLAIGKSTDGLTLRITPKDGGMMRESITETFDELGTKTCGFGATRLLMVPFEGMLSNCGSYAQITPNEKGETIIGLEDFVLDAIARPIYEYPSYEEGLASVKADFDGFCESVCPSVPDEFESGRLQALWQTWSMIVDPDGESDYKRTMVKMVHSIFEAAFVWQQPMQAVWLSGNEALAWEIFCSGFEYLDKNGRMVDALSYRLFYGSDALKPPVHGMCLLWLMDNIDMSKISKESKEFVWEGLRRWTEYFFKFRDYDKDGLPEFLQTIETGWEDAPYYATIGFPSSSPDLNSMLALSLEALAKLGRDIGKEETVCTEYEIRSKSTIDKIVEKYWNGKTWFAFNSKTGAKSDTSTISLYVPLILGKRLPQEIIDKSIEFMFAPGGMFTDYGLASEALNSDYFIHGFTQGSVIAPAQFLMVLGLEECGRSDLAQKVAHNYCKTMRDNGFYHIHNALTGKADRSLTAFGEPGLFWSAWASSGYFWMANRYCK